MIDFAPGMRTIIRDEEWMVKKIETNSLGNKTLYCVGISPLVKDREAIFLTDLEEIQIVDPAEVKLVADTSPFYKRALLYLESQWRQQIPTDANLHIGHKAAMDLMPYQLDPAKLALQRPRQRILIADTVGLGKTLEAGILMSELIARGKGKRILVVTVKSMMTQFQKEMWNRFTIPLVRLDSNRIQKIRANLVDVDEDHDISSAYRMDNEDFPFGYEFVRKATLREINFGESDMTGEKLSVSGVEEVRKGFRICKYCGKIQPENGKANHSFACKTRKMPALMQANAYEECLFLYREFSTEILRLLVPATTMDSSSVKMESFVAAFMLGMKEYFGNVDHLRATVSEVPVPDADYRKQYLVIYDSVPGGTGYLKQLMHEKNALIEIFERALHVMENCSCKDDPQKDGCYHCLYAYRQSQQIGNISRTTAIRILKSILSGKDNVQKIDKINDIPVNPLFDSELEQRFMEAIRTKVGAANVSDTIRNGKHSYYVKIENFAWEIEPQVPLDAGSGVSVDCKPDFVFWPVSAPEHKPVAVFTDGFLYHKDIVSDDTIKREAIRRSGNFRVWSLSFKDVQSVFAPQGDFYTTTLEAEKMPSGKTMYQNMIKKQKADVIEPARLSSFDLLLEYLKLPDAERVFKGQAYAYSLSLLEPALMKNNLAFNNWEMIVKAVNDQTHFTNADFVFLGTIFGSWIPRTSNAHLAIHSAILASELKAGGAVAVCAVLNDEKDRRTDKYEQEWKSTLKQAQFRCLMFKL